MLRTLASRLTFFYALLFCGLALVLFLIVDSSMETYLLENVDAQLRNEAAEFASFLESGGMATLRQQLRFEEDSEDVQEVFFRIFDGDQRLVFSTDLSAWPVLPDPDPPGAKGLKTFSSSAYDHPIRIIERPLADGYDFQMGVRLEDNRLLLSHLRKVYAAAFGAVLLLGGGGGFYITRKVLGGLRRVRQAADRISAGDLSESVPADNGAEEINALIHSVNHMQQRIRTLIDELQNVTNDIAHDLRSPVTRMRGLAETSLLGRQSEEDYRGLAGAVVEECDSLVGMINTMLDIAETDAGLKPLSVQPLDIREIIEDVSELYSAVAEDKQIHLARKITAGDLSVSAERSRLQRALANLLDNAVKFTPTGGKVLLEAFQEQGCVAVRVSDSGQGIAPTDLPHVCERHFRADHSRSTPGSGLGLSLVQSIVKAHGGTLAIDSDLDHGTRVTIRLPQGRA
jgi:heavy metal sensor kinase